MFDTRHELIPPGLDEMEPGPQLAGFLASVDVDTVSGYDRIVVLRAHQRLASHYSAAVYRDMASVADVMVYEFADQPHDAAEAAAAEIRVALHLTRRAADVELSFALDLKRRLPGLAEMLACGEIDVRRARTIERGTVHLSMAEARSVVDQITGDAPQLTTGQLAARIRRLCIDADPTEAQQRYKTAVTDRRIVSEPSETGTAHLLGLDLPPDRVAAITRRINTIARSLRDSSEPRTMDQLRADVFLDILDGANHGTSRRGMVDIHVDLETLTRLADHPGELAGYGPVIADIARQVTENQQGAEWRVTATDPNTGELVYVGTTRRRPTAGLRRRVEARDRTCVFPGCRMPAIDSDLDHRKSVAEGGPTTERNLGPLCRRDHCIKHSAGWTYKRLRNGRHRWTTKLGHTYTTTSATSRVPP
ncbi:MAG: HNH endonuclease signature motif containing protein [Acidimicrobiia bacterium]|nr:MAG: HNH endonuclease signature motif containing protein [Acidimicrobiia bacterium]